MCPQRSPGGLWAALAPDEGYCPRELGESAYRRGESVEERHVTDQYPQNNPHQPQPEGQPTDAQVVTPITEQRRRPRRFNPAVARKRRQERNATFEFVLENTLDEEGNPTSALCRKPNIFDAEELLQLPKHIQGEVFQLIEETQKAEGEFQQSGKDPSLSEMAEQYGSLTTMADAACLAGFIDPRLYATEEEADANGGVWVKDIDFQDRMAFFNLITGEQREAAASVAGFHQGPMGDVRAGSTGDPVPAAGQPEHHPAPGGSVPGPGHEPVASGGDGA